MLRTSLLIIGIACALPVMAQGTKSHRQFHIQGKFFTKIDEDKDTIRVPKFTLLDGHAGQYTYGGAFSFAGAASGPGPGLPWGLSLTVKVNGLEADKLQVEVGVRHTSLTMDARSATERTAAMQTVMLGRIGSTLKLVIDEDAQGSPRRWLELTVAE